MRRTFVAAAMCLAASLACGGEPEPASIPDGPGQPSTLVPITPTTEPGSLPENSSAPTLPPSWTPAAVPTLPEITAAPSMTPVQTDTSSPTLAPASPPANPPQGSLCDCSGGDRLNCRDFDSQQEAQACYDLCGGPSNDVHRLDVDLNGIACETVFPSPPANPPVNPPSNPPQSGVCDCSGDTLNCDDFNSKLDAQACFEFCGGVSNDIHGLDHDNDGEVCETTRY